MSQQKSYHYTSILYLSQRADYRGGDFIYTDPPLSEVTASPPVCLCVCVSVYRVCLCVCYA